MPRETEGEGEETDVELEALSLIDEVVPRDIEITLLRLKSDVKKLLKPMSPEQIKMLTALERMTPQKIIKLCERQKEKGTLIGFHDVRSFLVGFGFLLSLDKWSEVKKYLVIIDGDETR